MIRERREAWRDGMTRRGRKRNGKKGGNKEMLYEYIWRETEAKDRVVGRERKASCRRDGMTDRGE